MKKKVITALLTSGLLVTSLLPMSVQASNQTAVSSQVQSLSESQIRQKIINAGKKYLGTPYVYGSSRANPKTLDSSELVIWAYKDGAGIKLPPSGRTIGPWLKKVGTVTTDWRKLKPGDIMLLMSYRGYKASNYKGINKAKQPITHSGIYLGNGKILHTYSQQAGGVRIDSIIGKHWECRFLYGGSPF